MRKSLAKTESNEYYERRMKKAKKSKSVTSRKKQSPKHDESIDTDIQTRNPQMTNEAMKMDGFNDCIIGWCERANMEEVVAYDKWKVIEKLKKGGMSGSEAMEYFYYNQLGAWVGEGTPVFIDLKRKL